MAGGGIDAATLAAWLRDGEELALLDVREHGQYGEGHPFFAASLPYSRLEIDASRLVPGRATRAVLVDDDDGVAQRAARRLQAIGYANVHRLEGGAPAWRASGRTLFAGVNVPSKAFGEFVEAIYGTPRISAGELLRRRERGDALVVVDGRPFAEYHRMNIPGSICCPNGELAWRVHDLVEDEATTIVVNCAGRTRSIIGAQTLIEAGVPNPVFALENGTQGWMLDDLELERGSERRHRAGPPLRGADEARESARRLAQRLAVPRVSAATVRGWLREDASRSVYLCDVRSPEEYAAGSLPGAQSTPGGQLVQAFDEYVAVRHARLVLFDDDGVRATTTAGWLRRMGHDARVLEGGLEAGLAAGVEAEFAARRTCAPAGTPSTSDALRGLASIDAAAALRGLERGESRLLDLRSSADFRAAHLRGARWAIRPRLDRLPDRPAAARSVLVAGDARIAALAAIDLVEAGEPEPRVLAGARDAWNVEPHHVLSSPSEPSDAERIDFLFFAHDRHQGNKEAARRYLAWETQLLAQLDEDERAAFAPGAASPQA